MKTRQRKTIGKKRKSASAISFSILAVKVDAVDAAVGLIAIGLLA